MGKKKNIAGVAEPLKSGLITFINKAVPPLKDGSYRLSVGQALKNKAVTDKSSPLYIDENYINEKNFAVSDERFSLSPQAVYSNFPPSNSEGEYDNVLPSVVLNNKVLPWVRSAEGADGDSPWLALLLFDDDEPAPVVKSCQVGDLQHEPFLHSMDDAEKTPSNLPPETASYGDGYFALGKTFTLGYGENYYDKCNTIDVAIDVFESIAPSLADVSWLTHCRRVSAVDKEDSLRLLACNTPRLEGEEEGLTFATVVGNRMADPNKKCTAYLVSLEGMGKYLPTGDDYTPAKVPLAAGGDASKIRLVTLHSWSFASVDPKETFTGLLENLDKDSDIRVMQVKEKVSGSSPAEKTVANAIALGYTAINHHTRQGCTTVSWYRGPFMPFNVPPTIFIPLPDAETKAEPIGVADEAVRYNPETGMMDVTYGAAWELGRLMALKDQAFSIGLYKWKRENSLKTILAAEAAAIEEKMGETLNIDKEGLLNDPLVMHHAVGEFICKRIKGHLVSDDGDKDKGDNKDD